MKKVLMINATFRRGGNSELLCDAFADGARSKGHTVTTIHLRDLDLKFCIGCLYCQKEPRCVLNDSVNPLLEQIQLADALVFCTPIYYYAMAGQLKTFLDRMNPLFPRKNQFKHVYVLASAADEDPAAMDGAVQGIQGWVDCFEGVTIAGVIRGVDANEAGAILKTDAPQAAYQMGAGL